MDVGKSSLGNSILNRRDFKIATCQSDATQYASQETSLINGRVVNVVDTPGFLDTELDTKHVVDAISDAISFKPEGYHAILFVIRYGDRFTGEYGDTLHFFKEIFGANFVKDFCILVLTNGECFGCDRDEWFHRSFQEWCEQPRCKLGELINECNNRVVLFENKAILQSKKDLQVKNLIQMVDNLCKDRDRRSQIRFMNEAKESIMKQNSSRNG